MTDPIQLHDLYTDDINELVNLLRDLPNLDDPAIRKHVLHLALSAADHEFRHDIVTTALGVLSDFLHPDMFDPLLITLQSDAPYLTRIGAATILGQLKDLRAFEPLLQVFQTEEDDELLRAIADALANFGDVRAVEPLIEALKNDNPLIRYSVIYALGCLGDPRAIPPLIHALETDVDYVRSNAVIALGMLHATEAVPVLINHLDDKDTIWHGSDYLHRYVAAALDTIGTPEALEALQKWRHKHTKKWWQFWRR